MKILLVDDHELFREGVKLLLSDLAPELSFFEAADAATATMLADSGSFDVVLLDFHLPGVAGLDVLRDLRARQEGAVFVVLSAEDNPALICSVIDAGAAGFIPKTSSHAVMMAALRLVLAGGSYLPPHALQSVGTVTASQAPPLQHLTERQREILHLAVQGKPNKLIARELDISEATVKAHLSSIFRMLGVRNRTEAVFVAARGGSATVSPAAN